MKINEQERHKEEEVRLLERRLRDNSTSVLRRWILIRRIRRLTRKLEDVDYLEDRLSDYSLSASEKKRVLIKYGKIHRPIPTDDILTDRLRNRSLPADERRRLLKELARYWAATEGPKVDVPRFIPVHSHASIIDFLRKMRRHSEGILVFNMIPDYSTESLRELDEVLPGLKIHRVLTDKSENPELRFVIGVGSYFGETLIRALGGNWVFPGRLKMMRAFWTAKPEHYYRDIAVEFKGSRIEVIRIAEDVYRCRMSAGFSDSYQSFFE